jgi:hypothetical protein
MSKKSLFPRLGNIHETSMEEIYKQKYGETDGKNPAFVRSKPNKKLSPPPPPLKSSRSPPPPLKSSRSPPPLPLKSCIVELIGLDPTTELNEKRAIVVGVSHDNKKYIVMPIRIDGDIHNVLPDNMINIPLESLSYIQKGGRKRKSHKNRYSKRSKRTKRTTRTKRNI